MSRFSFPVVLLVYLGVFIIAISSQARAAQQPGAQIASATVNNQPSSDYGAGGHSTQTSTASGVLQGAVYDPQGNIRQEETDTYATSNGAQYKTEKQYFDFDPKLHLNLGADFKYDLHHNLTFTDFTHYGLHGERIGEEITNYTPTGYEIKDWSIGTHQWYSDSITYKTPLPTGTAATAPLTPTNTSIGALLPRSYLPGETVTGSLWPSSYAENFKTVPGLSEYSFPIQLYHLPDGSPEWSSLEIGVKGDGYVPVNPNGTFSLHIPFDWKGPLQLQAREPDALTGGLPGTASIGIDAPVAAPTLPGNMFSSQAAARLDQWTEYRLIDLWNEAYDRENELDEEYDAPNPDWELIDELEYELNDCYGEIDDVESGLPSSEIAALAHGLATDARDYNSWLSRQPNLTADEKADLTDSSGWASFLDDEAGDVSLRLTWNASDMQLQPLWANPVSTQGKLNVMRGFFPDDPLDTHISLGKFSLTPMAATPYDWYFMPPDDLTAGQYNYTIDSPLFPETILPVFNMTLTMGAGQLSLRKGQSTTYFARLNIFNGSSASFPGLFGGPPLYETDIIGASELGAIQQSAPTSRTGYITFSVTNQSSTIKMQNQSRVLNASGFVPSGFNEIDGSLTAIADGGFSILGVARANLAPVGGIGSTPAAPSSPGSPAMSSWIPSFSLNYNPNALSSSPLMTNCSAEVAAAAAPGASTPEGATASPASTGSSNAPSTCPASVEQDLYNQALGNQPPVPVDNTPKTIDKETAQKRYDDAVKKRNDAFKKFDSVSKEWLAAWDDAMSNVPQDVKDDYKKVLDRYHRAELDELHMKEKYKKDPSEQNARNHQEAVTEEARDEAEVGRFKEALVKFHFTDHDRAKWQAADDAFQQAIDELDKSQAELREAEEALPHAQN